MLLGAGLAVLLFSPVDSLVAGHFSGWALAVRALWALGLWLLAWLLPKAGRLTTRVLVSAAAGTAPLLFLPLALLAGGVGNAAYSWLVAMPLIAVVIAQEEVRAVVVASVMSVGSAVGAVAVTGGSVTQMVTWALLVLGASGMAVLASFSFRRRLVAEVAFAKAHADVLTKLADSETRRTHAERLAVVGRLAAGVAHEINNPLAYVTANLNCLTEESLGEPSLTRPELEGLLKETRDGVVRIRRIIDDLRVFAREENGAEERCSIEAVVYEAMRIASVKLKSRAEVQFDVPPGLPDTKVSHRQLSQSLLNVLINAGDALEESGQQRKPLVRIAAESKPGGVRLVVEDNGPGIPPAALSRMFEPFFTTKGPGKGTGLGLAVSRDYLERYGGALNCENRSEGGARFIFWLPGYDETEARQPAGGAQVDKATVAA
jgi:signal transduction histidine kinase